MKRKYNVSQWRSSTKDEKGCFISRFNSINDRDFTLKTSKKEAIYYIKDYVWNKRQLLNEIEKIEFSRP